MKKTHLFLLIVILFSFVMTSYAQDFISLQGSNETKWADGRETVSGSEQTKRYFENRMNLNLYYNNLRFGTRFTVLQPSEFGQNLSEQESLEKRFLEYQDPDADLKIRIGDFYTVWGRGLTLALFEDITQGFDSGLDGIMVSGGFSNIEIEAIAGRSNANFLGLVRQAQVNGAHIGGQLPLNMGFGLQGVLVTPSEDVSSYEENRTWGGYWNYNGSNLSLWAEHAKEYISGDDDEYDATYVSASTNVGSIGILLDYKRYRYKMHGNVAGGAGSQYAQSVGILPFHSAPIVQREFTSPLFAKHPHIVRYDDEVGLQLELTYSPFDWGSFVLSTAQSSSIGTDELFIPSLDEENSPYRELFLEMNAYPSPTWYMIGWIGMSEDLVFVNEESVRARVSWNQRKVLGTTQEFSISDDWSVKASAEAAAVENIHNDTNYMDALLILGLNWRTQYSFAATLETTSDDAEDTSEWFKIDARAFIANKHELLVTYGKERGGLVCTSGKCRLVTPFDGVKVTWTSLF